MLKRAGVHPKLNFDPGTAAALAGDVALTHLPDDLGGFAVTPQQYISRPGSYFNLAVVYLLTGYAKLSLYMHYHVLTSFEAPGSPLPRGPFVHPSKLSCRGLNYHMPRQDDPVYTQT